MWKIKFLEKGLSLNDKSLKKDYFRQLVMSISVS